MLDTKFAAVLQFHALLIAAGIFLARVNESIVLHDLIPAYMVGVLFGMVTLLSLRSLSRVQWGDLTLDQDVATAETQQVNRMIGSVVRRTARLRLATFLTFINLFLIMVIVGAIAIAVSSGV